MSRVLTLEVSDELYAAMEEEAQKYARSLEVVVTEYLESSFDRLADDPLVKLAGSIDSGIPDWGTHHDKFIGEHLMRELRDEEED